ARRLSSFLVLFVVAREASEEAAGGFDRFDRYAFLVDSAPDLREPFARSGPGQEFESIERRHVIVAGPATKLHAGLVGKVLASFLPVRKSRRARILSREVPERGRFAGGGIEVTAVAGVHERTRAFVVIGPAHAA